MGIHHRFIVASKTLITHCSTAKLARCKVTTRIQDTIRNRNRLKQGEYRKIGAEIRRGHHERYLQPSLSATEGRDADETHGKASLGVRPKSHLRTKYDMRVISWTRAAPAPARSWVTTQQKGQ